MSAKNLLKAYREAKDAVKASEKALVDDLLLLINEKYPNCEEGTFAFVEKDRIVGIMYVGSDEDVLYGEFGARAEADMTIILIN